MAFLLNNADYKRKIWAIAFERFDLPNSALLLISSSCSWKDTEAVLNLCPGGVCSKSSCHYSPSSLMSKRANKERRLNQRASCGKMFLTETALRFNFPQAWPTCRANVTYSIRFRERQKTQKSRGEAFLLTVGAFLLTVKLLCLQSVKALIRRIFPL